MMMRPFFILLAVTLTYGCASPSSDYFSAARHDVTLAGIDFSVFHEGERAQVIRYGYLTRSQRDQVPALTAEAVARSTGCRVVEGSMSTKIPGDTGVAEFRLRCPDA